MTKTDLNKKKNIIKPNMPKSCVRRVDNNKKISSLEKKNKKNKKNSIRNDRDIKNNVYLTQALSDFLPVPNVNITVDPQVEQLIENFTNSIDNAQLEITVEQSAKDLLTKVITLMQNSSLPTTLNIEHNNPLANTMNEGIQGIYKLFTEHKVLCLSVFATLFLYKESDRLFKNSFYPILGTILTSVCIAESADINRIIKDLTTKMGLSDDNTTQATFEWDDLVTLVVSFGSVSFPDFRYPKESLKTFIKDTKDFSKKKEGMVDFMSNALGFFQTLINWFRTQIFGMKEVNLLGTGSTAVQNWRDSVIAITERFRQGKFPIEQDNYDYVVSLDYQGMELASKTYSGTESIRVRTCVNLYRDTLKPILTFFGSSCLSGLGPRTEPLGVIFIGPSAIGKSALTQPMIVDVLGHVIPEDRKKAFEKEPYSFIYSRNAEHDYWDGYHGQMVCVYDDFGQVVDTPGSDSESLSIIRAINPFPFTVHMADLKSKGVVRFTSKIVFATSNNENIHPTTVKESQALKRRFKYSFRVSVNPLYSMKKTDSNGVEQNVLDPSKLPTEDSSETKTFFNEDVYLFERFDWGGHGHPTIGDRKYTYSEVVSMLVKGYKEREVQGTSYNAGVMKRAQRMYPININQTQSPLTFAEEGEEEKEKDEPQPINISDLDIASQLGYTDKIMLMISEYIISAKERGVLKRLYPNIIFRTHGSFPEARLISLKNLEKHDLTSNLVAYVQTNNVVLEYLLERSLSPTSIIPLLGIRQLVRERWPSFKTEFYTDFANIDLDNLDLFVEASGTKQFPTPAKDNTHTTMFDDLGDKEFLKLCFYVSQRKRDLSKHYPVPSWNLAGVIEPAFRHATTNSVLSQSPDFSVMVTYALYNALIKEPNHEKFRPSIFIKQVENAQEQADITFVDWMKSLHDRFGVWYDSRKTTLDAIASVLTTLVFIVAAYKTTTMCLGLFKGIFSTKEKTDDLVYELQNMSQEFKQNQKLRKGGFRKGRKAVRFNKSNVHFTESKELDTYVVLSEDLNGRDIYTEGDWTDSHSIAIRNIVKKNMFYLFRDSLDYSIGMCIFIRGKTVLINRHYIWYMKEKIERGLMAPDEPLYIHHSARDFDIPIYLEQMEESVTRNPDLAAKDLIMLDVDVAFSFPDITNHFLPQDTLDKLSVVKARLTMLDGNSVQHYITMAHKESNITAVSHHGQEAHIPNAFTYKIPTEPGWCGSILFAEDKTLCGANILGIHSVGASGTRGYATIVSREDIRRRDSVCCTQALDLPFEGNFYPIRIAPKPVLSPVASSIRKTPIFGLITKNLHFPARLKAFSDHEGEYINPMYKAVSRYGVGVVEFDPRSIDLATEMYTNQLLSVQISLPDPREKKILSFEEAVLGIAGDDNIDSLPRNTSAGYPYNCSPAKGYNGKEYFFGKGADYDLDRSEAIILKQEVMSIIEKALLGIRSEHIYTDFLKDELRSIKKIKEGTTRLVSCSPIHLSIVMRMYFMSFSAFLMDENLECDVGIGINVYGPEWSHLARKIQTKGDKIISGDFKNFDGSQVTYIQEKVLQVINAWYDGTDAENKIRTVLWKEVTNSIHICEDIIYGWRQGMSSGNVLTTTINSIYNNIVFRACWIDLNPCRHIRPTDFRLHVAIVTYGDDNILNVSDEAYDFFNQFAIQEAMLKYNLTYTNADKKKIVLNEVENIHTATFLKRNFLFSSIVNRYVAPLNLQVILEMSSWTKKGILADQIAREKVDTSIAELSLHSEEVFNTWINKILTVSAEQLHHRPSLTTRKSLQFKLNSMASY